MEVIRMKTRTNIKTLIVFTLLAVIGISLAPIQAEAIEPKLLWEREFDPPLIEISDRNSAGEYIALQGGRVDDAWNPTKILFLNSTGQTVREIELQKKEKRILPPEQVWLTYPASLIISREEIDKEKKEIEIETETITAYLSGNGEYFGIVTMDTERVGIDNRSPWYEFSYYDRTGKLLWKVLPQDNYGGPDITISYNGSLVFIADEETTNYKAQKWYLYDGKGNLIKTETHDLGGLSKEERYKEKGEWIESIDISNNGKYIAYTKRGYADDSKAGLMDRNGNVLWEKDFGGRHSHPGVHDSGYMRFGMRTTAYPQYLLVNNEGDIIGTYKSVGFTPSGNYFGPRKENNDEDGFIIIDSTTNKPTFELKASDIFKEPKAWLSSLTFIAERYVFLTHYIPKVDKVATLVIYDMKERNIVWSRKGYHYKTYAKPVDNELLAYESEEWKKITRVTAFEYSKGGEK
jgi:hypothetical protein